MKNTYTLIALAVITMIVIAVISFDQGYNYAKHQEEQAYVVCIKANQKIDGASEKACAKAQYDTNTNFMCNDIVINANSCWLEVK